MKAQKSYGRAVAVGLFLAAVAVWLPYGRLYLLNTTNLTLPFAAHLPRLALLGGLVFLVAAALQLETPRRMRPAFRAALLALGVFAWAQTTLLVGEFGFFTGAGPDWDAHRHLLFLEIGLAALLIVAVVRYRDRLLRFAGPLMLVLTLSAAANLVGPWRAETSRTKPEVRHTFTRTGVFDVSPERNVLIFILDTYQGDVFADIVADDPSWRAVFDGFTYFPDAVSGYPKTYASIPELLSGRSFANTEPFPVYLREAYLEASAPRLLKKNGFDVRYDAIVWAPYLAHPDVADNLAGFDAAEGIRGMRDREVALMTDLLAFRLAPFVLKPRIHDRIGFGRRAEADQDDANSLALPDSLRVFSAGNDHEDFAFLDELLAFMAADSARPAARIYHLGGPHAPFEVDAQMTYTGPREYAPGPFRDQSVASLRMMELVFERLREAGAYDNSLIVIVGDHGNGQLPTLRIATDAWARLDGGPVAAATDDPDLLEVVRGGLPLMLAKPPGARGPLEVSSAPVELADVAATVVRVMDLDGADAVPGRSLFAPDPDPDRKRLHRSYEFAGWGQDYIVPMTEWEVAGFSWDPRSWSRTDRNLNRNAARSIRGGLALLGEHGNLDDYAHAGWTPPDGEGRFIAGDSASIVFPAPDALPSPALLLNLRQVAFDPDARLRIATARGPVADLAIGGIAPNRYRFVLPETALEPGEPAGFRFSLEPGGNRRTQFVEIRLDHDFRRPAWPLGATVDFGEQGDGRFYRNHGWGVAEPWGVWTRGPRATLSLSVGGPVRGDLVVRAKLMGAVFEGSPPVRARLVANGTAVAAFVCEKQGPAEHVFRIPGHLVPESGALDLAIEVANPRSPRQHGLNDDPRLLGVGVWSLAISESRAER